ncbi:MAG: hypothetical protein ACLFUH_05470 [Bacteroidales bacterium]
MKIRITKEDVYPYYQTYPIKPGICIGKEVELTQEEYEKIKELQKKSKELQDLLEKKYS